MQMTKSLRIHYPLQGTEVVCTCGPFRVRLVYDFRNNLRTVLRDCFFDGYLPHSRAHPSTLSWDPYGRLTLASWYQRGILFRPRGPAYILFLSEKAGTVIDYRNDSKDLGYLVPLHIPSPPEDSLWP